MDALPVLARLDRGRVPLLTLTLPNQTALDARWVLRAWASGQPDPQGDRPLLLSSLVKEHTLHPAGPLTLVRTEPATSLEVIDLLGPDGDLSRAGGPFRGEAADRPGIGPKDRPTKAMPGR